LTRAAGSVTGFGVNRSGSKILSFFVEIQKFVCYNFKMEKGRTYGSPFRRCSHLRGQVLNERGGIQAMTSGQILFTSGLVLLALTVVLAIIFALKKPQYKPENEAVKDSLNTQKLRNGYPTVQVATQRDGGETEKLSDKTESI